MKQWAQTVRFAYLCWCGGGQLFIDSLAFSWDKGEHIELGISTYKMASKQLSWFLLKYEESNTLEVEVVKNKQTKQQKTAHKTKQMKEMQAKSENPESHLFKTLVNLWLCSWTRRNPVWNTEGKESYSIALSIFMEFYHILLD